MNPPKPQQLPLLHLAWVLPLACLASCSANASSSEGDAHDIRPLQPLIYTELPDLTPEAAAVRERRLLRQLLDGASQHKMWGHMTKKPKPSLNTAEALGNTLYQAIMERDETLWEHGFIDPESYTRMVHVRLENAHKFVDELLGSSHKLWKLFHIKHNSEAPEGGLASIFTFEALELGQGRTISGKIAKKDDNIAQYWGNVLKIGWKGTPVVFELRIPKILRYVNEDKKSKPVTLAVASSIKIDPKLVVFIAAGLHLKTELLRSREYPYPIAVGNFWRYKRHNSISSTGRAPGEPLPKPSMETQEPLVLGAEEEVHFDATSVLLEVLKVERYGSLRLAKLRRAYNDQALTKDEFYWLVTPRRVYPCNRSCVRNIEKPAWLLEHLRTRTALFRWPLQRDQKWGMEHPTSRQKRKIKAQHWRVDPKYQTVEVQAGTFKNAISIRSKKARDKIDPFLQAAKLTTTFVRSRGVVKRELHGLNRRGEHTIVTEELLESRIMP